MASRSKQAQQKANTPLETSASIEEQTKAFLASGGKIESVASGVTGQDNTRGPRHITLGKPRNA